jgi:hypothetical protein
MCQAPKIVENVISGFDSFWRVHTKPLKTDGKLSLIAVTPG